MTTKTLSPAVLAVRHAKIEEALALLNQATNMLVFACRDTAAAYQNSNYVIPCMLEVVPEIERLHFYLDNPAVAEVMIPEQVLYADDELPALPVLDEELAGEDELAFLNAPWPTYSDHPNFLGFDADGLSIYSDSTGI